MLSAGNTTTSTHTHDASRPPAEGGWHMMSTIDIRVHEQYTSTCCREASTTLLTDADKSTCVFRSITHTHKTSCSWLLFHKPIDANEVGFAKLQCIITTRVVSMPMHRVQSL